MAFQSNASFKSFFDDVTAPLVKTTPQYLAKHSKVLDFLYRPVDGSNGKPVTGIPTTKDRYKKIEMNANYALTSDKMDKYNIQFGDTKVLEKERNLMYAEVQAVDKGFTMGITREDLQRIKNYGTKSQLVNWIEDYWKKSMAGFAMSLTNSIYNGDGASAIRWDGEAKPDFDGLKTIVSTSTYGGKSTTDFGEWKGQVFDLTDAATLAKLGLAAADIDTIDEFVAVPTGKKNTRFYDMINKVRRAILRLSYDDSVAMIMNPATYDNLWIPSLEANSIGYESRFNAGNGNALEVKDDIMKIGNTTIMVEDTRVPTTSIGASAEYILPTDTIYILSKQSLVLEAHEDCNFVVTPWVDIPSQYGVMQKSLETTLLFYPKSRYNLAKIILPAAIKTELDGRQFI